MVIDTEKDPIYCSECGNPLNISYNFSPSGSKVFAACSHCDKLFANVEEERDDLKNKFAEAAALVNKLYLIL